MYQGVCFTTSKSIIQTNPVLPCLRWCLCAWRDDSHIRQLPVAAACRRLRPDQGRQWWGCVPRPARPSTGRDFSRQQGVPLTLPSLLLKLTCECWQYRCLPSLALWLLVTTERVLTTRQGPNPPMTAAARSGRRCCEASTGARMTTDASRFALVFAGPFLRGWRALQARHSASRSGRSVRWQMQADQPLPLRPHFVPTHANHTLAAAALAKAPRYFRLLTA